MGLLTTVKRLFGVPAGKDRKLVCQDCEKTFIFDEGEQRFFKSKGFTDPKRCPKCRKKVRPSGKRKRRGRNFNRGRHSSRGRSVVDGSSPYLDV